MSKPSSGHFQGTAGSNHSGSAHFTNYSASDIIAERVKGMDLRPHPTKYKQPSPQRLKKLRAKERNQTITKQEYKLLDWSRRFSRRRERGRDTFWDEECERIRKGLRSTRNWSSEQRKDILNKKRPKYKGKTLEAHHAYPASMYPHLADRHEVIYPVTHSEHLHGWHGGSYRKAIPGKPIKKKSDF